MKKITAPGKIKAKRRRQEAQAALESDAGEIVVVKTQRPRARTKIPMRQLKSVISLTLQRISVEEYGHELDQLNAKEYFAHEIARALVYGVRRNNGLMEPGLPMKEHEFKTVPMCQACKDGG